MSYCITIANTMLIRYILSMAKYSIPDRQFALGRKKMVSMRLPEALMKELEKIAEKKGWNLTDLVTTILDQYLQYEKEKRG